MDELSRFDRAPRPRRWTPHAGHDAAMLAPHRRVFGRRPPSVFGGSSIVPSSSSSSPNRLITLDGSHGEGGGQVLRTALTLSLLTGRPFRIHRIRAHRDRPGLRPQHLAAVLAAAELGRAEVIGAEVGSRDLTFRPGPVEPRDLTFDIGTAGATAMVLHTLALPLAMRASSPVRVGLVGGTFNTKAPSFPYLQNTWAPAMKALGLNIAVSMPRAGFYPEGGGLLEAWVEPGQPHALVVLDGGAVRSIRGTAGVTNLAGRSIGERMRDRALASFQERGLPKSVPISIDLADWPGRGRGAALSLTAETEHGLPLTAVGLGERGKPAEQVADDATEELLSWLDVDGEGARATAAVDPHLADQLLLPLALAEGRSVISVVAVTEHLRTNADTIAAFLDRPIRVEVENGEAPDRPGRLLVG
jgi:RNA 3'-terminal phosphate cyclase (ATP)